MTKQDQQQDDAAEIIPVISTPSELLEMGICKVEKLPSCLSTRESCHFWAKALTQITPLIAFGQGDDEYPFYRNIMPSQEPELNFPLLEEILLSPEIQAALAKYFNIENATTELRLDDAFVVHYNSNQLTTNGRKHMDPSDITINICLEKNFGPLEGGSHVQFYGKQKLLHNFIGSEEEGEGAVEESQSLPFLVPQEEMTATIHYGHHPHETTSLITTNTTNTMMRRTNIILTFCYTDKTRQNDALKRNCFFTS